MKTAAQALTTVLILLLATTALQASGPAGIYAVVYFRTAGGSEHSRIREWKRNHRGPVCVRRPGSK